MMAQIRSPNTGTEVGASRKNPKRRRISLACNVCRSRKSRCSGDYPCSLCSQLGFICEYEPSVHSTNVIIRKEVVTDLEQRLKALEGLVQQYNERSQGIDLIGERQTETPFTFHSEQSQQSRPTPKSSVISIHDLTDRPPKDNVVDGMAITTTEGEDSAFFGPSSNIAFLRHIMQLTRNGETEHKLGRFPTTKDSTQHGSISVARVTTYSRENNKQHQPDLHILPPQLEAEALIDHYFMNTGLLYPYLHESTFRRTFQKMKGSGFAQVPRTWLALLNMVFAVSVKSTINSTTSSEERASEAEQYYNRAMRLCGEDMYRGTSLEIAQCLLLMAQYLQSTQDSVQTWCIHGLAVKAAMSLGLHSAEAARACSRLEQEMRVRVWYGCVMLDRTLGMTFGRPWAIPQAYVKLRKPAVFARDPEVVAERPVPYADVSLCFFNATLNLYEITTKVISSLYGENLDCDQAESGARTTGRLLPHIASLVEQLEQWWLSIPDALKWREARIPEPTLEEFHIMQRFRNILKIRFLNLQILMYRPVLFTASESISRIEQGDHSFSNHITRECLCKLARCSMLLVQIVDEAVGSEGEQRDLLDAPWFSLYYVFNAALALFATFTTVPYVLGPTPDLFQRALGSAIRILENIDAGNKTGRACAQYLRRLLPSTFKNDTSNAPPASTTYKDNIVPRSESPSFFISTVTSAGTEGPDSRFNSWDMDFGLQLQTDLNIAQFFNPEELDMLVARNIAHQPSIERFFDTTREDAAGVALEA